MTEDTASPEEATARLLINIALFAGGCLILAGDPKLTEQAAVSRAEGIWNEAARIAKEAK